MKSRKIGLFILVMFFSNLAFADCHHNQCKGKISFIYINEDAVRIKMDQDMSPLNCSLGGGRYLTLRNNHPFKGEIYKLLLLSHASEKSNVTVRISENTVGCNISYITSSH